MFSYIILHYKNINETIECLTNLKKIIGTDDHLIVVDNNTLSNTEEKLISAFTNDILKLDKNYGFAKANNKGIIYAKKKYYSDFYVVINNDVIICDYEFQNKIIKDYQTYKFDMLGTKINSPSGESVNPFPALKTRKNILKEINKCQKLIKIYQSSFLTSLLKLYIKIKHIIKKPIILSNGIGIEKKIALHGCAIIFSNQYIEKYKDPFYNETFLFYEEEFIYQRVLKDNLISIYDPKIEAFHKEGSSINKSYKNKRLSKLFREKEKLISLKLLLDSIGE